MQTLKQFIMGNNNIMKKKLSNGNVVTIAYDLKVMDGHNVNDEIKEYLIRHEWHFTIPESEICEFGAVDRINPNEDMPETTAWRKDISPSDAIDNFLNAINEYKYKHAGGHVPKGKVFAVCNNVYRALKF